MSGSSIYAPGMAQDPLVPLSLLRTTLGVGGFLTPRLGLRVLGISRWTPETPYFVRVFASRDAALGVLTLLAAPADRAMLLKVGLAVDGSDALASLLALRAGSIGRGTGVVLTAASLAAVATGAVALGHRPTAERSR